MKQEKMGKENNRRPAIRWSLALAVAIVMTVAIQSSATTLYESQTSTNPSPPYATWDTASHSILDAVDVSSDGDEVLVAPGEYDLSNQVTVTTYKECRWQRWSYSKSFFETGRKLSWWRRGIAFDCYCRRQIRSWCRAWSLSDHYGCRMTGIRLVQANFATGHKAE
jgi:hypothetical protein